MYPGNKMRVIVALIISFDKIMVNKIKIKNLTELFCPSLYGHT